MTICAARLQITIGLHFNMYRLDVLSQLHNPFHHILILLILCPTPSNLSEPLPGSPMAMSCKMCTSWVASALELRNDEAIPIS